MKTASPERVRRTAPDRPALLRWSTLSIGGVLVVLAAVLGLLVSSPVASAAPGDGSGCGYGAGGPSADTLCWINLSAYSDFTARSGAGQPMSTTLPGGYTVNFTVHTSGDRGVVPSAFPTWDYGAAVGKYIYLGTPGQPALYQVTGGGAAATTISLTDIAVTDGSGNAVHGWRFVGVDAESTSDSESITFSSNKAVSTLATFTPPSGTNGCQVSVVQLDANTIRCTGSGIGDVYGTVLVGATEPSSFSQTMTVGNGPSREGVAFAFQTSTVSLDAVVAGRVNPSDSFDVSVVSPESTTVGSGGTGTTDNGTTGDLVVLPRVDGSSFTLRETAGAGTDLAAYTVSWACTRNGVADPSLSATGVASITVSPAAGEAIDCTVTNTYATTPGTSTTTTTAPTTPGGTVVIPATTTSTTSTTTTTTTTIVDEETTTSTTEAVAPIETTPPTGPAVEPTRTVPQALARTGADHAVPLALFGSALLAFGLAATWLGRRRTA